MKSVDEIRTMGEVDGRLPTVMSCIIATPLDEVLVLVAIAPAVEDLFDFVFKCVVDLDWIGGWGVEAINGIPVPWGETIDVENRVLVHLRRELQTISKLASPFEDFVRS
jgi:hypothetical protein